MTPQPPGHLIDPKTGTVHLLLFPYDKERLHAPPSYLEGLPNPLPPDANPFSVSLRAGMTPEQIGPQGGFEQNSSLKETSWWRWDAYALTPYGWATNPVPFFDNGRLSGLNLNRQGSEEIKNWSLMSVWLEGELGPPTESKSIGVPWVPSNTDDWRIWRFGWGGVVLTFEPRDGAAALGIGWAV